MSFGIDHLRAARHLEHVLRERRPQRGEARAARRAHDAAVGVTDDVVVLDDPGVGVELTARDEDDEVAPAAVVDEQDALARREDPAHDTLRFATTTVDAVFMRIARVPASGPRPGRAALAWAVTTSGG